MQNHTNPTNAWTGIFGGWSPLYSLQPSVSPPIYHRPKINHPTEIHHLTKSSSANYIKKLKSPSHQSWLPFYQQHQSNEYIIDNNQAKLIRYNVRKPPSPKHSSKSNVYPKYPQYLPTTVLHLKKVSPKKQIKIPYQMNGNKMMNIYSVPIKPYSIKNVFTNSQPIIYEQLDYHLSNQHFIYPKNSIKGNYGMSQPKKNYFPINNKQINKPKKTTIAAYIPIVQVPKIEAPYIQPVQLNNLPILEKKPMRDHQKKVIEEHIYRIPNHMLHEIRHEANKPKSINNYPVYSSPIVQQMSTMPSKQPLVSHVEQSYGSTPTHQTAYIEISKPQVVFEVSNSKNYNNNNNYNNGHKLQIKGPPLYEIPYQMDNYAKAEDAGLFKPLLDQTRQTNNYPKIGAVPYKDNDPEI